MKKTIQKMLASIMTIVLLLSCIPFSASAVSGSEIVSYARQFVGCPYVHAGKGPNSFDCSGFVAYVFKHFAISLPAGSWAYWNTPTKYGTVIDTGSVSKAKAGDVIVWNGHVAIYTENGYCVEALNKKYGVTDQFKVDSHTNGKNYKVLRIKGVGTEIASAPTVSTSNYLGGVKVSLACATSGATVYYTTNGSTPTTSSTKYTGAFNLTSTATVKAIAVKSGMTTSAVTSKAVTVNKTATPKISSATTSSEFNVTITAEKGAAVYYTTDGTAPTTKSTRYNGQFPLTSSATVKAIAVADGKAVSDISTSSISAQVPKAPAVKLETPSNGICGVGDEIRISWGQVSNAAAYEIEANIECLNGDVEVLTDTMSQTGVYSFIATDAGEYTITVKAVNFLGKSAANSPAIKVMVKPNVKVTFKDHDGTVISQQPVKYGGNAIAPAAPSRKGYTFTNWKGSYNSVKSDVTVTAVYTPNTYTVKFIDSNGNSLASELVEYQKGVKNIPAAPSKTGYKFVAWSVKSGEGDSYEKVNGDVVFEPTYVWANPDMPLAITAKKAIRSSDATSYSITVNIVNSKSAVVNGKLIAVIKTQNDKVVATKIDVVSVPANASNYSQTIIVGGTAAGSVAEVYVVANDSVNDNRTGGAYSEKSAVAVTQESSNTSTYWGSWSGWSTTKATSSSTKEVQSKTQYRYRDKQTTTSTSSSLSGWTSNGSSEPYISSYGAWSDWQTASVSSSTTREVQTGALYRYYYYKCSKCGYRDAYCNRACEKCGTKITSSNWHCVWSPMKYSEASWYNYGTAGVKCYTFKIDGERYFFSKGNANATKIGTVDACSSEQVIVKGYRYRTIYYSTTYYYYKWNSWSSWSDSAYSSSSTRQVEARTVYRYRDLLTKTTTSSNNYIGEEDTSGTVYKISGTLKNISGDYSGKIATIMVYKDKNIDPTEDQMQYVGQTKIGASNSYNFSFIPKDAISAETGNYVVSFGIATADGLINNIEIIEAPKPSYNVVFKDTNGNILDNQTVVSGEDAVPPSISEQNGYDVSWNRSFTNITRDTEITLVATAKTYNIIFVDWANDEIVDIAEAEYGSEIEFPANCTAEGKSFIGWSVPEGTTVTETMVIEAVYEDLIFTVNFLNDDGSVYEERKVSYGATATFPEENPTAEGLEFVAWSNDSEWWNVTEDISVYPIFIFEQTVETPIVLQNSEINIGFTNVDFETSTEDAIIRYTTDGTEPTEESVIFDDTLWIEESTTFMVKAFKEGMNDSSTVEIAFEVIPEDEYESKLPKVTAVTTGSYHTVGTDSAKICMRIDNPSEFTINSWGYLIENMSTNETSDYINTDISGMTDITVSKIFDVTSLSASTIYSYTFYVEFEELGVYESETYTFTTKSNASDIEPTPVELPEIRINRTSTTIINYGETLVLKLEEIEIPEGYNFEWFVEGAGVSTWVSEDGLECRVTSIANGNAVISAKLVNEDGEALSNANGEAISDEIIITSKAGFWQRIISFFKNLFGINRVIY